MESALSFGAVLQALKANRGAYAFRLGWNGLNQVIRLQRPDENSKMTQAYIYFEKVVGESSGDNGTTKYLRIPWLASQADMLEEDWVIRFDEAFSTGVGLSDAVTDLSNKVIPENFEREYSEEGPKQLALGI